MFFTVIPQTKNVIFIFFNFRFISTSSQGFTDHQRFFLESLTILLLTCGVWVAFLWKCTQENPSLVVPMRYILCHLYKNYNLHNYNINNYKYIMTIKVEESNRNLNKLGIISCSVTGDLDLEFFRYIGFIWKHFILLGCIIIFF